uniref:Uncharacterized protein n=1 Tax=viral metagenome TaxID=1070528 RepID=A0A6C0F045_9ZZZZ
MDYHSMSLAELKQIARDRTPKIKKYYIIPRAKLIELLLMDKLPESFIIEKKTIHELRKEAQAKQLPNIWNLKRSELMELLYPIKMDLGDQNIDNLKKDVRNKE